MFLVNWISSMGRTITVKIVEKALQKRALGGMIHAFKAGGKLSGYGGGDKIHALLEAGEFIIRKEAVAKFGAGLFNSLNNFQLPQLPPLPHFATGGSVGITQPQAPPIKYEHNLRTQDGRQATVFTDDLNADRLLGILNDALVSSS